MYKMEKVAQHINEIVEPTNEIVEPTNEIVEPTNEIVEPTNEIVEPTNEIVEPTNEIVNMNKNVNELNIIDLIEKNPITRLSKTYHGNLLSKIKLNFTNFEQQLFVTSFYCYLNYNTKTDFIIDLDSVWKWIGFSQKIRAKELLEKNFQPEIDYKCLVSSQRNQTKNRGGHNKETIMMTIRTFKMFCLKAGTKKANEIHTYYINMEDILQEVVNEESNELRQQIEQKNIKIEEIENEKEKLREKTLLEQFENNQQCVYYGLIDNTSTKNEKLIKFGNSNNLRLRVSQHKKTYTNFRLCNAFKVENKVQIETAMKREPKLKRKIRSIHINGSNYVELMAIDNLTLIQVDEIIKQIINENEYNVENYTKILIKNEELEKTIYELTEKNKDLEKNNKKLEEDIEKILPSKEEKKLKYNNFSITSNNGFLLYAFQINPNRYKWGICRPDGLTNRIALLQGFHPDGELKTTTPLKNSFMEKPVYWLLKDRLMNMGNDTFEGSLEDINAIFDIAKTFEDRIVDKNASLDDILQNTTPPPTVAANHDPEIPTVRKARRSIDQINPANNEIVANYPSIEAAGKALGLTTGTAIGIALRNKTLCRGSSWRYAGFSNEDFSTAQPVIKVCCNNGERHTFKSMKEAAKDANISIPGLRNRILTKVHIDQYHWIFDDITTHYTT
jgi:hypothetical protein